MKDKIVKNPNRKEVYEIPKYVPEYKLRNISPVKMSSGNLRFVENKLENFPTKNPNTSLQYDVNNQVYVSMDDDLFDENGEIFDNRPFSLPPSLANPDKNIQLLTNDSGDLVIDEEPNSSSDIPEIGQYILMVNHEVILTGDKVEVESRLKKIIYGEDEKYLNVNSDDVILLKRVGLKVGVFLGE